MMAPPYSFRIFQIRPERLATLESSDLMEFSIWVTFWPI